MLNTRLFFAVLFLTVILSCKEKNRSVYESCCGAEPTEDHFTFPMKLYDANWNLVDSFMEASIYIPNIFIIDNSGDNNFLNVFSNNSVIEIQSILFTDENGELLFSRENVQPNDPAAGGWDGEKSDGTLYKGSFNYKVVVEFLNGQTKTYEGQACAYHCHEEGFPAGNLPNCCFPSQHDGNGGRDEQLPGSGYCF